MAGLETESVMTLEKLAGELRRRLLSRGLVPAETLKSVPDLNVVESYVTCSCCGRKQLQGEALLAVVSEANSVDQFFDIADRSGHGDAIH